MRILFSIHIAAVLLITNLCATTSGKHLSSTLDDARKDGSVAVNDSPHVEDIDDIDVAMKTDDSKEENQEEDKLPILPPIILLDFANQTDDENATFDEKSKRTVNSGLGYGLNQNSFHPKRYNYYFPGGKSGTTVSIEESISPFMPKTIIERIQPNNQKIFLGTRQNSFASSFPELNANNQADLRYLNPQQSQLKSHTVFGLRTKPQKGTATSAFESYQNFVSTPKPSVGSYTAQNSGYKGNGVSSTTQSPLAFSATESVRYVTPGPTNFASASSGSFNYATPSPFSLNAQTYNDQRQNSQSNINSHDFAPLSQSVESSTVSPFNYNSPFSSASSQFSNSQRYTVENGVRYENKIFWKYPDGRVSDVPPSTYVEYSQPLAQQATKSQEPASIYESSTTENTILSQGPVQFPTVSEQAEQEPNPFVSSESLSSSLPQQQVYRLGYQNLVSQRQNLNLAQQRKPSSNHATSYSFSSASASPLRRPKPPSNAPKTNYDPYYRQTFTRYMVNSPNPEYTNAYTTEATINTTTPLNNRFDASAEHASRIKSKYTSKVQNYLDTLLSQEDESKKHSLGNNNLNSYSNLQYTDLLNYNPSISEYIRNPSSILNVRPTFVQAGNSLIPVIILRVDGASPIQSKASQNINLKALLQQYLIQYAKSIQELARPSTYNLGAESLSKGQSPSVPGKSPVLDLIRLTQEDARDSPSYDSNSYTGRSSYETSNLEGAKGFSDVRYNQHPTSRPKVKNVQILEDPRFTTYNVKN